MSGSPAPRITLVASSTVSNSLRGMPIMSQITSSGNGCDSTSTRSTSPCSQKPSITSVQIVSTESSTPWSCRGVNERATMPRWRAWRGSSMLMNEPKNSRASAGMSGIDTAPLPGAEVLRAAADLDHLGVAGDGVEPLRLPRSSGCRTRRGGTAPCSRSSANSAMRSSSGSCQKSGSIRRLGSRAAIGRRYLQIDGS